MDQALTRVGTPKEAVRTIDRNLFLLVGGQKKFRGFLQKIDGRFTYVRLYEDRNILRYLDGGAMSVDATVLLVLDEYRITDIHYHWGGAVYRTTVSEVRRFGVYKALGFQVAQYHLPLAKWTRTAPYKRRWVPKVAEEIVQDVPGAQ